MLDLTESNPTKVGLDYPEREILASLADPRVSTYAPDPRGWISAREAISEYYSTFGKHVPSSNIVLTAGTSEAYGFLFKLLCDAGDRVLVPKPSYPLFDFLLSLDNVEAVAYSNDTGVFEPLPERCRAILAVHPNNPTGIYVHEDEARRLHGLSARHGLALIVDEVFLDYALVDDPPPSFAGASKGLVFTLSGLSKLAALPQVKLSWIAVSGAPELCRDALDRLETISDTYLSVSTAAQLAVPRLLALAPSIRRGLNDRIRHNLSTLRLAVEHSPEVTLLPLEGGWYQTLRLPAIATSESWALDFLKKASVYLHPGLYFGFETEACCVVSLIVDPSVFREATHRMLRRIADRIN